MFYLSETLVFSLANAWAALGPMGTPRGIHRGTMGAHWVPMGAHGAPVEGPWGPIGAQGGSMGEPYI